MGNKNKLLHKALNQNDPKLIGEFFLTSEEKEFIEKILMNSLNRIYLGLNTDQDIIISYEVFKTIKEFYLPIYRKLGLNNKTIEELKTRISKYS